MSAATMTDTELDALAEAIAARLASRLPDPEPEPRPAYADDLDEVIGTLALLMSQDRRERARSAA